MILKVLTRNKGRFISRTVFAKLLGLPVGSGSRAVDMHVSRLRKKISTLNSNSGNHLPDGPVRSASGYGWTIDPLI